MEEEKKGPKNVSKKGTSEDRENLLMSTLYKVLGFPFVKPSPGIKIAQYAKDYGPTLTLLDVDFSKAPGYLVTPDKNRQHGKEPTRKEGNISVNKFPSRTEILSVPYYMLAEQVAQIVRFLNLPASFVVSLEPLKNIDPYYILARKHNPKSKKPVPAALKERDDGLITGLPVHNKENSLKQQQRRKDNVTARPHARQEELIPMDTDVVDAGDEDSGENGNGDNKGNREDYNDNNGNQEDYNDNKEREPPAKQQKNNEYEAGNFMLEGDSFVFMLDQEEMPWNLIPSQENWIVDNELRDIFAENSE